MPPSPREDDMKLFRITLATAVAAFALQVSPARASDDLPIGMAESKNRVQRTLTIDDQVYKVTAKTEIFDLTGQPLPFEQVETAADHDDGIDLDRVTYAYDAHGDVLVLLRAVRAPR